MHSPNVIMYLCSDLFRPYFFARQNIQELDFLQSDSIDKNDPRKDPCFINLDFQFLECPTKKPVTKFKAQEKRFPEKACRFLCLKEKRIILIKFT